MSILRVAFYTGGDKVSQLIRWRTWGGPSHVGLLTQDGRHVLHARAFKGVSIDPLTHSASVGTRVDVLVIEVSEDVVSLIWQLAEAQLGKSYDYLGNAGFVLRRNMHASDSWFCSELVAWLFWAAGVPLLARVPSWKYSPEDLWRSPLLHPVAGFYIDADRLGNRFLRLSAPNGQKTRQKASEAQTALGQGPTPETNYAKACKPLPVDSEPLNLKSDALEALQ